MVRMMIVMMVVVMVVVKMVKNSQSLEDTQVRYTSHQTASAQYSSFKNISGFILLILNLVHLVHLHVGHHVHLHVGHLI